MRERCDKCGRRLYRDESQLQHEYSGRCWARAAAPEYTGPGIFASDWSVAASASREKCNPRSWGAGLKKGGTRSVAAPEHGTRSRYTSRKHLCRCRLCTDAANAYARQRTQQRKASRA